MVRSYVLLAPMSVPVVIMTPATVATALKHFILDYRNTLNH